MSAELVARAAEARHFYPRNRFHELAADHVPFDELLGTRAFEARALRGCVGREGVVGVLGPRGGGKSSLIAHVSSQLPKSHLPLRVPVAVIDDVTSVEVVCALALDRALEEFELDDDQRHDLDKARAEEVTVARDAGGFGGAKLGGGAVPVEVTLEAGSLREELRKTPATSERFAGLDRLISILISRGVRPVFILEDTEAAIGGEDRATAEGFLAGPLRALARELDAALLVAIQDVFTTIQEFQHLASSMAMIEIPALDPDQARQALTRIVEDRLEANGASADVAAVLDDEALDLLVRFYGETDRSLRFTLATLQTACELAAEDGAEAIGHGHLRAATEAWRER
jgi:hypothetical protein